MAKHLFLTHDERSELSQLTLSGKQSARVLGRERILALPDRSQSIKRTLTEAADVMMTSSGTVYNGKNAILRAGWKISYTIGALPPKIPASSSKDFSQL